MLSGNVMIIHLMVGLIKKISLYKMSHFPELYTHSKNKTKVELDWSNYAIKSDLKKNRTGVDTSDFDEKNDLASLKLDIDELYIDKL